MTTLQIIANRIQVLKPNLNKFDLEAKLQIVELVLNNCENVSQSISFNYDCFKQAPGATIGLVSLTVNTYISNL